jgi:hypothetical protein
MSVLTEAGILAVIIGFFLLFFGNRSRGEMRIRLGFFKGPIWFLLIMFGLFVMILDSIRL